MSGIFYLVAITERGNLIFTLQILELERPTVLALNMANLLKGESEGGAGIPFPQFLFLIFTLRLYDVHKRKLKKGNNHKG